MKESAGKSGSKKVVPPLEEPSFWQKYANAILIPIIIALTVFLLVRFRMDAAAKEKAAEADALTAIRMRLTDLRNHDYADLPVAPEQIAVLRDSTFDQISKMIENLLSSAKEPNIRAAALLAQGDLNWQMANFPELPGATTRPSLAGPRSPQECLDAAARAYKQVTDDYVDQRFMDLSAHMGLGAVAENRGAWDEAAKYYKIVADDKDAPESFRVQARSRLETIKIVRDPLYIGTRPLTTQPSATQPASTQPEMTPATKPTK